MSIDTEIADLAALALGEAFYKEFSLLVNSYMRLAEGLPTADAVRCRLQTLANVHSRLEDGYDHKHRIVSVIGRKTKHHETLLDALMYTGTREIYVNDHRVFARLIGDPWQYVGDT